MSLSPPLRFLAVTIGTWVCLRGAMMAPPFWVEEGAAEPKLPNLATVPAASPAPSFAAAPGFAAPPGARFGGAPQPAFGGRPGPPRVIAEATPTRFRGTPPRAATVQAFVTTAFAYLPAAPPLRQRQQPLLSSRVTPAPVSRWSASAWVLARDDGGSGLLAPGGTLGGSQAGARLLYRLGRETGAPWALSARFYMPLQRRSGAEAAAGLDWRPFARFPIHLLAERRQALGRNGRSAFALTFYGGHSGPIGRRLSVEAYAQAGAVGLRSRDAFFDGSLRLSLPVGRFDIGGGAWAAAQPGVERFDVGPSVAMRLPMGNARLRADWRFRIAGDAAPASGPAVTLASDF